MRLSMSNGRVVLKLIDLKTIFSYERSIVFVPNALSIVWRADRPGVVLFSSSS